MTCAQAKYVHTVLDTNSACITSQKREANVAKVENICQQYPKTPLSVVSLEESVFPAMEKGAAAQALKDYLLSFKSLSAKEDAYRQLIQHAILGSTVKLGFVILARKL